MHLAPPLHVAHSSVSRSTLPRPPHPYQRNPWCYNSRKGSSCRECIERKFPSIKVYYREEEPGCDVFYTNDADRIYFPERYFLDNYDEPLYYETIEEAAKYIGETIGKELTPDFAKIENAIDDYMDEHDNSDESWMSFHRFEVYDD
jgi:hypothetical protein